MSPLRTSLPEVPFAPLQPPVAVQLLALVVDQLSVDAPPLATDAGVAVSVTVGSGAGLTVIVTDWTAEPPLPVQVSVKEPVAVRFVRCSLPEVDLVPLQPPEAVQELAFVLDQVSVVDPPLITVVGEAVSETDGADGPTVTVVDCAAVPPGPAQVNVKVVVDAIEVRCSEPAVALLPPHPPLAVQLVALFELQVRVVDPPAATVDGVAVSVTEGMVGCVTVTLTDCVAEPPAPLQVSAKAELEVSAPVEAVPEVVLLPLQLPDATHELASVEDQVRVAAVPEASVEGATASVTVGAGGAVGGCVTLAVTVWPAVPPAPEQVNV